MPTHYEKTIDETMIDENKIYDKILHIFIQLLITFPEINYKITIADGCPYCITNTSRTEPKYIVYMENGTLMCVCTNCYEENVYITSNHILMESCIKLFHTIFDSQINKCVEDTKHILKTQISQLFGIYLTPIQEDTVYDQLQEIMHTIS
jgi:hypothetical protein